MNWYTKVIEDRLDAQQKTMLQGFHEPSCVTVPLLNSRRQTCVMPNGALRQYSSSDGYSESLDGGLSWRFRKLKKSEMGAATRNPKSGRYCTVVAKEDGTYALFSDLGPDDDNYQSVKISEKVYIDIFQPAFLEEYDRWIVTMSAFSDPSSYGPAVAWSDDDAQSWTVTEPSKAPDHRPVFPDKGLRWQNAGSEPVLTLLPNGELYMLARTSLDYLWEYRSKDGGKTWSEGKASPFHATLTTPNFLRLGDGRVLLFWCNTIPMPEENHRGRINVFDFHERGEMEELFTNRDVCHVAITSDGVHWSGMRELLLTPIRNSGDYRYNGERGDKGMQQFQALELPFGRILADVGQNCSCRRTVIFSLDWLYETERSESLEDGMRYLSTFLYRNSVSGSTSFAYSVGDEKMNGHCAWNRADGPMPVPSPDGELREVLQINRYHDERLFSEVQGAVWNFPASAFGEIRIRLWIGGAGLRISLCDHWLNPSDPTVAYRTNASFCLSDACVKKGCWQDLLIRYDTERGIARVYDESLENAAESCRPGGVLTTLRFRSAAPLGLSYLHLQTLAEEADPFGTYVRSLEQKALSNSPFSAESV